MTGSESGGRQKIWRLARRVRGWLRAKGLWTHLEPLGLWLAPRLLAPATEETSTTLAGGIRLVFPPQFPPAQSYQDGEYEPELTRWFLRTIEPGWTVVDAGANIGYYSVLASRCVGPTGRVFAFEPDPTNFDYLLRNLELNHCANVYPVRLALGDHAGQSLFRRDRYRAEGHLSQESATRPGMISVESGRLDDFMASKQIRAVDLMKFDIEGGEPAALRGANETVSRSPNVRLVVEYNRRALARGGGHDSDLFTALRTLGFTRARSLELPGGDFRIDDAVRLAGPSQNLEVWR